MKTIEAVNVYNLLKIGKFSSMDGRSQISFLRVMKTLRPVAESYAKDIEEAREKMKGDDFEVFQERMEKWLQREKFLMDKAKKENVEYDSLLTEEEVKEVKELNDIDRLYTKKFMDYKKELDESEVGMELQKVEETAFEKFIEANDFEAEKKLLLQEVLC